MAARGRKPGFGRFYVYAIHDGDGVPVYIGKGIGRRLDLQRGRFARPGYILRRFRTEDAAFQFDARMVAELKPQMNRCPGGAGGRASKRIVRLPACYREMERVGTRVYAARELLKFDLTGYVTPKQIDAIRQVAASG